MKITGGEGDKETEGKLRWDLLYIPAIEEIIRVYEYGLKKYEENNWKKGISYSKLFSACLRHLMDFFIRRKKVDDESGLHPLAHAAWHCITLIGYDKYLKLEQFDDRPIEKGTK